MTTINLTERTSSYDMDSIGLGRGLDESLQEARVNSGMSYVRLGIEIDEQ